MQNYPLNIITLHSLSVPFFVQEAKTDPLTWAFAQFDSGLHFF